jgi:bifunctional non-homologous end joining protein LigD
MKRVASKSGQGRKAPVPDFVPPELATLVATAPVGAEWLHELKYDGFRILCRVAGGRASLLTRSGQDWTSRFPTVAEAAARLPVTNAWLDGEVAIVMPDGRTSFQALQNGGAGEGQALAYFVFDLLHLDGRDLRTLPLETRKQALRALTPSASSRTTSGTIRYSDHEDGDGRAFFAAACEAGLEGIVSKRRDRPHVPGRSSDWLKTKCVKRQEFVIGGFTDPKGGRAGLGALLVGTNEGGQLRYAGKVGTGFTRQSATELTRRLADLARATSPFSPPAKPTPKSVHWCLQSCSPRSPSPR